MSERTVLIEATIDRVDTDLVSAEAGRDPRLVRVRMRDRYYFIDARDVDGDAFKAAAALPTGIAVTACVGERQGRANIFWLKDARPVESKDKGRGKAKDRLERVAIAPSDVRRQARRSFRALVICACVMAAALLVMAIIGLEGSVVLRVLSILAATISVVVGALCTVGLIDALDPMRRAAQSSWSGA